MGVFGKKALKDPDSEYKKIKQKVADDYEEYEDYSEEIEEPVKKKTKNKWKVLEIPIQSQRVLYNPNTNERMDLYDCMAYLMNLIEEIE